jgi:hypothetical protein
VIFLAQTAAGPLDALAESIRSLPWAAHALAGVGLTAGLILWAMGRQVLRPVLCILGAVVGGGAGFFLLPLVTPAEVWEVPTPLLGLGVGSIMGAASAFGLYRFAVAISFASVTALAGVLVSVVTLQLTTQATDATTAALDAARQHLSQLDQEHQAALAPPPAAQLQDTRAQALARDAADRARAFLSALGSEFGTRWESLPGQSRAIVLMSTLGGAFVGFLMGVVMPTRSAAAVTAGFGGAVWLPSAVWLSSLLHLPGRGLMDLSATTWLVAWVVVALIGFTVQMSGRKPAAAPSKK